MSDEANHRCLGDPFLIDSNWVLQLTVCSYHTDTFCVGAKAIPSRASVTLKNRETKLHVNGKRRTSVKMRISKKRKCSR